MNFTTNTDRGELKERIEEKITKSIHEGVQYGEASLLIALLKAKFKELPDEYVKKIDAADVNTIHKWAINFMFAKNSISPIKKVFNRILIATLLSLLSFPYYKCFSYEFKKNLLQDYSEKEESKYPAPPYLAKFKNGKKKLLYIAALHEVSINSKTIKLIHKVFKDYHPQIVIIEGFQPNNLNEALEDEIKECAPKKFENCSESIFSGFLAKKQDSHILTGEPSNRVILDELIKKGYSLEDYLGFYLLRQIPQWKRERKVDNNLEDMSQRFLKSCLNDVNEKSNFDFEAFKVWYRNRVNFRFELDKINENIASPKTQLFMNKLWLTLERVREINIIKTIEKAISLYDNVLIVYGASHFTVENGVLTDLLGAPEIISHYAGSEYRQTTYKKNQLRTASRK